MTRRNTVEHFWERVDITPGCWIWTATKNKAGYGHFKWWTDYSRLPIGGRLTLAHRISWIVHNGQIPAGLCVCHKCDNPACVNPWHLFLGTNAENTADRTAKGRTAPQQGTQNPRCKLTESAVLRIRALRAAGVPRKEVARLTGASRAQVRQVHERKTWRHL